MALTYINFSFSFLSIPVLPDNILGLPLIQFGASAPPEGIGACIASVVACIASVIPLIKGLIYGVSAIIAACVINIFD